MTYYEIVISRFPFDGFPSTASLRRILHIYLFLIILFMSPYDDIFLLQWTIIIIIITVPMLIPISDLMSVFD